MRQDEQDVDEVDDAPEVGVDRPGLHYVVEVYCSIDLEERFKLIFTVI